MAQYTPVEPTDPNYPILSKLDMSRQQYVVMYQDAVTLARTLFGMYKSTSLAFRACKSLGLTAGALCFILTGGAAYYVNTNGHPLHR